MALLGPIEVPNANKKLGHAYIWSYETQVRRPRDTPSHETELCIGNRKDFRAYRRPRESGTLRGSEELDRVWLR